jgi:hypothetical protein
MTRSEGAHSGGCQCGAVRFRVTRLGRPTICHCRMCQKAFGSFFGPFVTALEMQWTRGAPKYFASSDHMQRGFCGTCGTPLSYEKTTPGPEDHTELAIGAFDDPTVAAPVMQVNLNDRLPFFAGLPGLPERTEYPAEWLEFMAQLTSHQHPDHDTETWPPAKGHAT